MAAQADPTQRLDAIRQREREKREQSRQTNREQYPELAQFVDEAQPMAARVTQLNGQGKDFDDRIRCKDCSNSGKVYRKTKFDERTKNVTLDGCRLFDAGKELERPRRCTEFLPRC